MCYFSRQYPKYFSWKKYSFGIFGYIITDFTKLDYTLSVFFFRKQLLRTKISFPTNLFSLRLKICTILVIFKKNSTFNNEYSSTFAINLFWNCVSQITSLFMAKWFWFLVIFHFITMTSVRNYWFEKYVNDLIIYYK